MGIKNKYDNQYNQYDHKYDDECAKYIGNFFVEKYKTYCVNNNDEYDKCLFIITGYAKSGKTTLANIIKECMLENNIRCEISSFAKQLKYFSKKYFIIDKNSEKINTIDKSEMYSRLNHFLEDNEEFKNVPYFEWNNLFSLNDGREFLQYFGTDIVRKYLGENYWIDKTKNHIYELFNNDVDVVLIDDCRFENEAMLSFDDLRINVSKYILRKMKYNTIPLEHSSEREIDYIIPDYFVYNIEKKMIIKCIKL